MLTLNHINIIRDSMSDKDDAAKAAFATLTADEQYAYFLDVFTKTKQVTADKVAGAMVVFYRTVARSLVQPNTPEHTALRATFCPVVTKWHKDNPPADAISLIDNQPSWNPEVDKTTEIAGLLSYDEALDPAKIACAIRNAFGIGGYEDMGDSNAIGLTDPTMAMLVGFARNRLVPLAPQWFVKDASGKFVLRPATEVPDKRPIAAVKAEIAAVEKAKKDKERNERRAKEVEAAREQWVKDRETLIVALAQVPATLAVIYAESTRIAALPFEDAAKLFRETYSLPEAVATAVAQLAATLPGDTALNAAKTALAAEQAVLMGVGEKQPTWLTTNADRNLVFRRAPLAKPAKEPGSFTRVEGEILRAVFRMVDKHGSDTVLAVLKDHVVAAQGVDPKLITTVFGDAQAKPCFTLQTPEGLYREKTEESPANG